MQSRRAPAWPQLVNMPDEEELLADPSDDDISERPDLSGDEAEAGEEEQADIDLSGDEAEAGEEEQADIEQPSLETVDKAIQSFYELVGGDMALTFSTSDIHSELGLSIYREVDVQAALKALCEAGIDGASTPAYMVKEDGKFGLVDK